jgi:DNA repair exonuclease SbcCD ATPase subunit
MSFKLDANLIKSVMGKVKDEISNKIEEYNLKDIPRLLSLEKNINSKIKNMDSREIKLKDMLEDIFNREEILCKKEKYLIEKFGCDIIYPDDISNLEKDLEDSKNKKINQLESEDNLETINLDETNFNLKEKELNLKAHELDSKSNQLNLKAYELNLKSNELDSMENNLKLKFKELEDKQEELKKIESKIDSDKIMLQKMILDFECKSKSTNPPAETIQTATKPVIKTFQPVQLDSAEYMRRQNEFNNLIKIHLTNKVIQKLNSNSTVRNQFVNFATQSINNYKNNFVQQNQNHQVVCNIHNVFRYEYRNGKHYPTQLNDLTLMYFDDPELIKYIYGLLNC